MEPMRAAAKEAVRDTLLSEEGEILMTRVADKAATRAVESFAVKMGIDPSPAGLIQFQTNLRTIERWSRRADSAVTRVVLVIIGLLLAGWATVTVAGVKELLSKTQ